MIKFIKGTVESIEIDSFIIECNGIGYRIFSSSQSIASFSVGSQGKVYTQMIVRENDLFLVGFSTLNEQDMFKLLTGVSGVGPKVALSILSVGNYRELAMAILSGDVKTLSSASGVGKKTAERIIIDLRDKVEKFGYNDENLTFSEGGIISNIPKSGITPEGAQALEALLVLGYTKREADEMFAKIDTTGKTVEELIKEALSSR